MGVLFLIPVKALLRYVMLLIAIAAVLGGTAQVNFKTVVPQRPVAVGESIQVQYVVENGEEITNFSTPVYPGFRYVTGPNVYAGKSQSTRYKNMVVTLVPVKTGRFIIHGASCMINGMTYTRSEERRVGQEWRVRWSTEA